MTDIDLEPYITQSESIISESPQMDEENTKTKLITPLVDALGWNVYSQEVELEYSVTIAHSNNSVDYALKSDGNPSVFVEAKGLDTSLSDDDENQLRDYMRQKGVEWGLLTNGQRFILLKRDSGSQTPDERIIGETRLEELRESPFPLDFIAKEAVDTGEAEKRAQNLAAKHQAVADLRDEKTNLADSITGEISHVIGDSFNQDLEPLAKGFVDDIIDTLEANIRDPSSFGGTNGGSGEGEVGTYIVRLTAGATEIQELSADRQSDLMVAVVRFLCEEYGLLDQLELPYVPGEKMPLLARSTDPEESEEMRQPKQINEGLYLETHDNKAGKKRSLKDLAGKAGLGVEFAGEW